MDRQNKTANDAWLRVLDARMACMVDASDEYLLALECEALKWADEIRQELAKRIQQADKQAA